MFDNLGNPTQESFGSLALLKIPLTNAILSNFGDVWKTTLPNCIKNYSADALNCFEDALRDEKVCALQVISEPPSSNGGSAKGKLRPVTIPQGVAQTAIIIGLLDFYMNYLTPQWIIVASEWNAWLF